MPNPFEEMLDDLFADEDLIQDSVRFVAIDGSGEATVAAIRQNVQRTYGAADLNEQQGAFSFVVKRAPIETGLGRALRVEDSAYFNSERLFVTSILEIANGSLNVTISRQLNNVVNYS